MHSKCKVILVDIAQTLKELYSHVIIFAAVREWALGDVETHEDSCLCWYGQIAIYLDVRVQQFHWTSCHNGIQAKRFIQNLRVKSCMAYIQNLMYQKIPVPYRLNC